MRSLSTVLAALLTLSAAAPLLAQQPPPGGANEPQRTAPLGTEAPSPQAPGAPPGSSAPVPAPSNVVAPPPMGRVFAAEQGLIFNAIRPEKVADFEMVVAKLRSALADSQDPVRKQQGTGWKVYKAAEPGPNNSVLYVFVMDPVVKGADYGVAKILAEAYPDEIMTLYRMYSGAFATAGQTLVNLKPVP